MVPQVGQGQGEKFFYATWTRLPKWMYLQKKKKLSGFITLGLKLKNKYQILCPRFAKDRQRKILMSHECDYQKECTIKHSFLSCNAVINTRLHELYCRKLWQRWSLTATSSRFWTTVIGRSLNSCQRTWDRCAISTASGELIDLRLTLLL